MSDSEKMAIESICYWLNYERDYPSIYNKFFIQWMLFNSYYSKYLAGDKKGVIKFAEEYGDTMWENENLTEVACKIAEVECVGNGKGENPPHPEVKSATIFLRELVGIDHDSICSNICREQKKLQGSSVRPAKGVKKKGVRSCFLPNLGDVVEFDELFSCLFVKKVTD